MRLEMHGKPQMFQEQDQATILVVDDESIIRDLCGKILKDYRILEASSGIEALKILELEPVDLLLTDVMMSGMSGIDLLKRVKEKEPNQAVVIMTGYADKELILKALKADADDFIIKPINLLQLRNTIEKILEKKRLKEELVQLKKMDQLKSDFLGLISHKLRTPTTAISLFIQNLSSGTIGPNDESFPKALELVEFESRHLGFLIQDLLFYSDTLLRNEQPQRTRQSLKDLAVAALAEFREPAGKKNISLVNTLDSTYPQMMLDKERVLFTLCALLDNAVKFTQENGQIVISGAIEKGTVHLIVQDNGQGIPDQDLPRVFEKFYQVDPSHTGQIRGFGLGLFYARQFVHDHGGSIAVESHLGEGTLVTLSFRR